MNILKEAEKRGKGFVKEGKSAVKGYVKSKVNRAVANNRILLGKSKKVGKRVISGGKTITGRIGSKVREHTSATKIGKGLLNKEFTARERSQFGINWNDAQKEAIKAAKKDPATLKAVKKNIKDLRKKFDSQKHTWEK